MTRAGVELAGEIVAIYPYSGLLKVVILLEDGRFLPTRLTEQIQVGKNDVYFHCPDLKDKIKAIKVLRECSVIVGDVMIGLKEAKDQYESNPSPLCVAKRLDSKRTTEVKNVIEAAGFEPDIRKRH